MKGGRMKKGDQRPLGAFGSRRGAVMMEYVIVAVMIAASVAVGAWYFGKDIVNMFGVAGKSVTGDSTGAIRAVEASQTAAADGHAEATSRNKDFIVTENEDIGDVDMH